LIRGILWDRVAERAPCFEVAELHSRRLLRYRLEVNHPGFALVDEHEAPDGVLYREPAFQIRAAVLDHGTPVLAFAFEPAKQINVRKDRLAARGLAPGPWLGKLKLCLLTGDDTAEIQLPEGQVAAAGPLGEELVLITPGKKLVYATDFADTVDNRRRLQHLAHGAHTLFCEASFIEADADQARRTGHLTTRACGEIAEAAEVARLVPFHFSRRYEDYPEQVYDEIATVCSRVMVPGLKHIH
jgi:ribonuclease Z